MHVMQSYICMFHFGTSTQVSFLTVEHVNVLIIFFLVHNRVQIDTSNGGSGGVMTW